MTHPKDLVLTRTFAVPRSIVWKAWTNPVELAKWFGPAMFTNPVCEVDLRVGGKMHIEMQDPQGNRYPMSATYEEIDPPSKLVFRSGALEDENGKPQLEVRNTITFEEIDGQTKITMKADVLTDIGPAHMALEGQKEGWSGSFDKLAALLTVK